jgi:hypothetical protein
MACLLVQLKDPKPVAKYIEAGVSSGHAQMNICCSQWVGWSHAPSSPPQCWTGPRLECTDCALRIGAALPKMLTNVVSSANTPQCWSSVAMFGPGSGALPLCPGGAPGPAAGQPAPTGPHRAGGEARIACAVCSVQVGNWVWGRLVNGFVYIAPRSFGGGAGGAGQAGHRVTAYCGSTARSFLTSNASAEFRCG